MARVDSLTIAIDGGADAKASISALLSALERVSDGSASLISEKLMTLHERGDLFVVKSAGSAARGAPILDVLEVLPSERYRELLFAVADEFDCDVVFVGHWPVLSSVSGSPTIAEGEGSASALPGGAA